MSKKHSVSIAHNLVGTTRKNWRILREHNIITPEHRAQARLIGFMSFLFSVPAALEHFLFDGRIKKQEIKEGPYYIVGFWRSGTTLLQNLLTRDPQFGWFDPVSTITFSNSILLRPFITPAMRRGLKNARPMDNMDYALNLPMEDVFALGTISEISITNMLNFPDGGAGAKYIESAFIDEQPQSMQDEWAGAYDYILKKVTYTHKGKPLLLKSPEHTCRIAALKKNYPGAGFINIYRNPYDVVMSTINMFEKEMNLLALNDAADRKTITDICVALFERVYRKAIPEMEALPPDDIINIKYEEFCTDMTGYIKLIYDKLGIGGFSEAEPYFKRYLDSQKNYKKNKFKLSVELKEKINSRLGFYFDKYGYEMI